MPTESADSAESTSEATSQPEKTPSDSDEDYKWGRWFSPEHLIPQFNPETYPLDAIGNDPREHASHVPTTIETRYPIEPDRVLAGVFFLILVAIVGAVATGVFASPMSLGTWIVFNAGLWLFVGVYFFTGVSWMRNTIQGLLSKSPPVKHGPESVQVRILTINASDIVQQTVDHLPDELTDRHIIAETEMEIDGADIHVVPEDFECVATNKGRAIEWARRNVPCEKEYVLYLDEDTLVTNFNGLPDADIIQFREWPMKTDSWLAYWAEVLRMGFQLEQVGYADRTIPLYAWGGGIAVRKTVEDEITWDFKTLIEDTVFVWFAVENGASFEVVETKFRNQAPPSLKAMCKQRRRWIVGTIQDEEYLSLPHQLLITVRNVVWAFSPLLLVLSIGMAILQIQTPLGNAFWGVTLFLLGITVLWLVLGIAYYEWSMQAAAAFIFSPIVLLWHATGAVWGFIFPPQKFQVTDKTETSDFSE